MKFRVFAFALAVLIPVLPAVADSVITMDHGAAWQTKKNGEDSQGFIVIHNSGDVADSLISVDCTIADSTVLVDASGQKLQSLNIPPGQAVTLSSSGPHIMIKHARYSVTKNSILPCAFTFALSGELIGYLNAIPVPAPPPPPQP
jgi:copper(I)-binding protein